jgi:dolichol-phosphate mannosyltransferase
VRSRAAVGCLKEVAWKIIFVDDNSPDGTSKKIRELARRNPQVRCLQRIGRRGLASACIEGMLSSSAPYFAVMDADLQHDEILLPAMLDILRKGDADLVIGSRYVAAGESVHGTTNVP